MCAGKDRIYAEWIKNQNQDDNAERYITAMRDHLANCQTCKDEIKRMVTKFQSAVHPEEVTQ